MALSAFDSPMLGGLFADTEAGGLLGDDALVQKMIAVEAALARACAQVGLIPGEAAATLSRELAHATVLPGDLRAGTASAGVPVPALVAALRAIAGPEGRWLHWGATSQDIVDCATILQWRDMLDLLGMRIGAVLDRLEEASAALADQPMAGRTRSQVAVPISLGLRIAQWAQPLIGLERELPGLRARLLRVQFGGAAGSASAVGDKGAALSAALAADLGLLDSPCWHTDRSAVVVLGGWLAALSAALAKLARDLIVMGRSEIAEMRAGAGGGSSTMPQKSNPVAAEAIVTLADFVALLQPGLARAAAPLEERDGAAWSLEWLCLPQMGMATAAALRHAQALADSLRPDPARMAAQLAQDGGAVLSEAASFALSAHMPREAAQAVVKEALAAAQGAGHSLIGQLSQDPRSRDLEIWPERLDAGHLLAPAQDMATRIFAQRLRPNHKDVTAQDQ